jgi:SPP1 family predicted phage head-tail adaptor
MAAGKYDRRICLQARTLSKGASGGLKETWVDEFEAWASVRNMSGNEGKATSAGGGERLEARTEFTFQYRAGVTGEMRVRYDGRIFTITHVNDWMEKHERIVLTCDLGVPDA